MKSVALTGVLLIVLLVGGAQAADSLTLTVASQTSSTLTLKWVPQPGYGYLFFTSSDGVTYKLVSRTNDPTRATVRFSKGPRAFKVSVITEGNSGTYSTVVTDTQPPTAPSGSITGRTGSSLTLDWQPSSDNVGVDHYHLFLNGSLVAETGATVYTYAGLACGTSYSVAVQASDKAGNLSDVAQSTWTNESTAACGPSPPSSGTLKWAPPALSNPVTINVTNAVRYYELNPGQDYIIKMPSTPLGRNPQSGYPALWLAGGRNLVMIGGEIKIDELANSSIPSVNQRGLMLSGQTGVAHIEGVWIHGAGMAQAISEDNGRGPAGTVQIQNSRLETMHPVWHVAEGEPAEVHTDTIQSWNGPTVLKLYQDTLISTGNVIQVQPKQYSNVTLGQWDYRRVNMVNTTPESYALWKQQGPWAEYHEDLWVKTDPRHPWASQQAAWANNATCWACWNPGGSWPITGEAMHVGLRPDGDFVPVGVAGIGYVSPGYQ